MGNTVKMAGGNIYVTVGLFIGRIFGFFSAFQFSIFSAKEIKLDAVNKNLGGGWSCFYLDLERHRHEPDPRLGA